MRHRKSEFLVAQFAVRKAAMILFPSRFIGELIEVLRADVMMLTDHHPAKTGNEAFSLVGAGAVPRIGFLVIDALHGVLGVQRVPMASLIGVDGGVRRHNAFHERQPFRFGLGNGSDGATAAFADDDQNAALVALVLGKAAINAVFFGFSGRTTPPT